MDSDAVGSEMPPEPTRMVDEVIRQQQSLFEGQRLRERNNLIATVTAALALATLVFALLNRIESRIDDNNRTSHERIDAIHAQIQEERRHFERRLEDDVDRLGDTVVGNIVRLTSVVERAAAHAHLHDSGPVQSAVSPPAADPPTP